MGKTQKDDLSRRDFLKKKSATVGVGATALVPDQADAQPIGNGTIQRISSPLGPVCRGLQRPLRLWSIEPR